MNYDQQIVDAVTEQLLSRCPHIERTGDGPADSCAEIVGHADSANELLATFAEHGLALVPSATLSDPLVDVAASWRTRVGDEAMLFAAIAFRAATRGRDTEAMWHWATEMAHLAGVYEIDEEQAQGIVDRHFSDLILRVGEETATDQENAPRD